MFTPINGYTKRKIINKIKKDFTVKAENPAGTCKYRTEGGAKCAVGLFIPDKMYTPRMDEQGAVACLLEKFPELTEFMPLQKMALRAMQQAHDESHPSLTKTRLLEWVKENVSDE